MFAKYAETFPGFEEPRDISKEAFWRLVTFDALKPRGAAAMERLVPETVMVIETFRAPELLELAWIVPEWFPVGAADAGVALTVIDAVAPGASEGIEAGENENEKPGMEKTANERFWAGSLPVEFRKMVPTVFSTPGAAKENIWLVAWKAGLGSTQAVAADELRPGVPSGFCQENDALTE